MLMVVEGGLKHPAEHEHSKVKTAANLCCAELDDRKAASVLCQDTTLYFQDV